MFMTGPESQEPQSQEAQSQEAQTPQEAKKPEIQNVESKANESKSFEQKNSGQKSSEPKPTLIGFVQDNLAETIAYVVLFAGLILSIFNPVIGGALVGVVLGIYFSQEIIVRAMSFKDLIMTEGIFRGFIVIAAVLALFIASPGLLLGTIIGAWIRPYLGNIISSPFDKK
jgi:hypothetical protein